MKTYKINGVDYTVDIEKDQNTVTIKHLDQVYTIECLPQLDCLRLNDRSYQISTESIDGLKYNLYINKNKIAVQKCFDKDFIETGANQFGSNHLQQVKANMPGRIVRIFVQEGQSISPNENLCVLEAMKMQNNIQSTRSGLIEKVFIQEGQTVEGGDLLFQFSKDQT